MPVRHGVLGRIARDEPRADACSSHVVGGDDAAGGAAHEDSEEPVVEEPVADDVGAGVRRLTDVQSRGLSTVECAASQGVVRGQDEEDSICGAAADVHSFDDGVLPAHHHDSSRRKLSYGKTADGGVSHRYGLSGFRVDLSVDTDADRVRLSGGNAATRCWRDRRFQPGAETGQGEAVGGDVEVLPVGAGAQEDGVARGGGLDRRLDGLAGHDDVHPPAIMVGCRGCRDR
jgi:hypothetical protein